MASTINSDNGVVSGSVGLKYASDNSGVLALQTNGNTAVTITTANNVGIGTTSPSYKLDVLATTARIYDDNATLLLQRPSNSRSGQLIVNNANGGLKYYAGNNGSGENGTVAHEFTSDAPSTGTVLARINSYGIGLGATTPSSGLGIAFPASQAASSDPNTLDDYEEGTWTPTFTASAGAITSYSSGGRYVKIGQSVSIWFYCIMTNAGSGSGTLSVSGLPFTTSTSTGSNQSQTPILCRETNNTGVIYGGFLDPGATTGNIHTLSTNTMPAYTTGYRYSAVATYQSAS